MVSSMTINAKMLIMLNLRRKKYTDAKIRVCPLYRPITFDLQCLAKTLFRPWLMKMCSMHFNCQNIQQTHCYLSKELLHGTINLKSD